MRRVFFCMLAAVLLLGRTAFAQTEEMKLRDALKTGELIRLHVIAAGDDDENQRIKLCVRDKVLAAWRDALSKQENAEDMMVYLEKNRQALEEAAMKAAREEGFSGDVSAMVGVFPFPDRWYGNVLVPAGEYKALRIVLGEGKGKNWWCVLFPSLCLSLSSQEAPLPQDQAEDDAQAAFSWWVQDIFRGWPMLTAV
jgi:stage II sporulation protein R